MTDENKKSDTISFSIKKDNVWKYSTLILLAVVVIGAFTLFNSGNPTGNIVNTNPSNGAPSVIQGNFEDDDAVLGSGNAPVTIIEFSDYQCPFCRKFWTETLPLIKSEYIDTGKVRFIYRDFPLTSIHPMAQPAAEAAECVRDQYGGDEAYFKYHDKIFEEQNILDSGSPQGPVQGTAQFSSSDLKKWAKDLGYNIDSCLDSGKFRSEVQNDLSDATSAGGRGTPYFLINGKPLSGAQPFNVFQQVIESEL